MDLFQSDGGGADDGLAPLRSDLVPLAERMRPATLDDYVGQDDVAGPDSPLRRLFSGGDQLRSLILWGPPGSGKTTLAHIISQHTDARFVRISAVTASIKDVKQIMEMARMELRHSGRRTLLFVDEIHRFNKAQQDAFLPFIEDGSIVLVGATTENPSFSLVSALLSRARVYVLKPLGEADLVVVLRRALEDAELGLGSAGAVVEDDVLGEIARLSDGDARRALNLLELAVSIAPHGPGDAGRLVDKEALRLVLQREHLVYDKSGEEHFNTISALHKSMRASDVQAAMYWTGRMLKSGEEPLYVLRRMIRFASEDIGNADPQALQMALAAHESYRILGSPEGELAIYQLACYLATAPKSNAVYKAMHRVQQEISTTGSLPVPMHIRNAPTSLMKDVGYGKGYQYDHDAEDGFSGQDCLPERAAERVFYRPGEYGFERDIGKRMEWWARKRAERGGRGGK